MFDYQNWYQQCVTSISNAESTVISDGLFSSAITMNFMILCYFTHEGYEQIVIGKDGGNYGQSKHIGAMLILQQKRDVSRVKNAKYGLVIDSFMFFCAHITVSLF